MLYYFVMDTVFFQHINSCMKYYKYLDLNWQPSAAKLKDYFYKHEQTFLSDLAQSGWKPTNTLDIIRHVPELLDMLAPLMVRIRFIAFFVTEHQYGLIHIDDDDYSKVRLNIPIINCEDTETRFFTATEPSEKIMQSNGIALHNLNPNACKQVDQYYLTQPVLFRNTEPHQVVSNNILQPRISCSIGFYQDLSYLLEE